jgi:hypothetical protein
MRDPSIFGCVFPPACGEARSGVFLGVVLWWADVGYDAPYDTAVHTSTWNPEGLSLARAARRKTTEPLAPWQSTYISDLQDFPPLKVGVTDASGRENETITEYIWGTQSPKAVPLPMKE